MRPALDRLEGRLLLTADIEVNRPFAAAIGLVSGDDGLHGMGSSHEEHGMGSGMEGGRSSDGSGTASVVAEALESSSVASALATANLRLTTALLVDVNNNPITAPVVGERFGIRAQYTTTDLQSSDQFVVRYWVDGLPLDSAIIQGVPGQNLSWFWYRAGWFASPGNHTVQVTVDGNNAIAEVNESDNSTSFNFTPMAPTTLPNKFVYPIGGVFRQDWNVVNYVDVDPRGGTAIDYLGGGFIYDGHDAMDITLPNFTRMEAGIPIMAAAAGVVSAVQDGNFDRQTGSNGDPANYVAIDHGNGWTTYYYHIARGTVAVKVGDTVSPSQIIGMVGSSGNSTDAHLHFSVYHNGATVETHYSPSDYWVTPIPYEGTVISVTDFGTSNSTVWDDFKERPDEVDVFSTSTNWAVWFWLRISQFSPSDAVRINWYRPNGVLDTFYTYTAPSLIRYGGFAWTLPSSRWSLFTGLWQAAFTINGVELARTSFLVTSGAGQPEVHVSQASSYLIDGRTTPVDFGSVVVGGAAPQKAFTIANRGSSVLNLSNPVMPPGFSLVGAFPASLAAGASATFTVQLDPTQAGAKFGAVEFSTNDADETVFQFNVGGTVTGSAPAGAPLITLPGAAVVAGINSQPTLLDPLALVTDSDSAHFQTGSLKVEFAAGGTADDRLAIVNQGLGAGQIGVNGASVTFGGIVIGTFAGGVGTAPLIVTFNANATVAAVQALVRRISYANVTATPVTQHRYVRFTLVDNTGKTSNQPIRVVIHRYLAGATITESGGGTAVAEGGATDTYSIALTVRPRADVQVTISPGGQLSTASTTLLFTPTNWFIPQTVTVSAIDDSTSEGNHAGTISHTGAAPNETLYNGVAFRAVNVAINDNDPASTASFVGTDAATQGSWKGTYGADGFVLAQDTSGGNPAIPSYATVTLQGQSAYTWVGSTTDPAALVKSTGTPTDRLAATWFAPSTFDIDVRLNDLNTHQIAVYALDWQDGTRSETIQLIDPASGTVLDTRSITNFANGVYLVWNVKGHVTIRVTKTSGPNAVISGLFFDPVAAPAHATYVATDASTQGSWKGTYGADGHNLAQDTSGGNPIVPSYASVTFRGQNNYTWAANTGQSAALQKSTGVPGDRLAATWYADNSFEIDVRINDGQTHQIALYALDWQDGRRSQTIQLFDTVSGAQLDSRSIASFSNGVYLVWNVSGRVTIKVTRNTGPNAVLSGLFFDPKSPAVFVKTDHTTYGSWKSQYGGDGHNLAQDTSGGNPILPAYASVEFKGTADYTWAASTTDVAALEKSTGSSTDRLAAAWYAANTFEIDVRFDDANSHQIALYALDWHDGSRRQTIQLFDTDTGALLDSRSIANFRNGVYLVWHVSVNITIKVTRTSGPNAVLSGLFFD